MPNTISIRATHTEPIDMQLLVNNSPLSLVGVARIRLVLHWGTSTNTYDSIDNPANLAITAAATGEIRFTPEQTAGLDQTVGYNGYIWVYPTATTRYSVPNSANFTITVLNT